MGVVLFAVNEGFLDEIEVNKVKDFEKSLLSFANSEYNEFMNNMESSGDFNDEIEKGLKEMLDKFVSTQTW